jgi:hypothetical protein
MIQHASRWILAALALAILAPASAAVAGDQVPIQGNITIIPDPPSNPMSVKRSITGIVSHLGSCTGVVFQTVTLQNYPILNFSGPFTLVAANGDTICGTTCGTLTPTLTPGIYCVNETIEIKGGTGRFYRATGSATGIGMANAGTGKAQESFEGTISSPGS